MNALDEELTQRLLAKESVVSDKAWKELYSNCYPVVSDMIRKRNGSDQDAFDIFQDGLLILNRNLKNGTFRGESSVKTFLFSVCKNLWLKEFSRKQKQQAAEAEADFYTQEDIEFLINTEIIILLMNDLQEGCRNILTEYYFNKRTMAELKELFNVNSIQAAKNKKWRCLGYLVKLYKEKGITPVWNK